MNALQGAFERDGYLVIDDFFDTELMIELDQLIHSHFGDTPDFLHSDEFLDKAKTDVIPWFPQKAGVDAFDEIERDSRLIELSESILGSGWTTQYCMVMFSRQGSSGQAWHQDCPPDDPGIFNLNRLVYTSDISDETGGQLVVVPASHKRGLLPVGDPVAELDDQVVLLPKQGTLVLIHGHTWHRVLPIKGKYRSSTNYRAAPAGTPDDVTDICVYRNMCYKFSTSKIIEDRVIS